MKIRSSVFITSSLLLGACLLAEEPKKPKPAFQYETDGIQISIPTADEPRVAKFDASTTAAAARYLNDGAVSWVREKSCVNCHTTGIYLSEWPALSAWLGKPNEEVREQFVENIPETTKVAVTEKDGLKHIPGAFTAVWRTLGLAEWDKHTTGKLSEDTLKSLKDMLLRQFPDGSYVSHGEVEIPHITTDFELSLQAARTFKSAPGWLESLTDADTLARVAKLKSWLREAPPRNDFDRILRLQLAHYFPELVTAEQKNTALGILTTRQHSDGGWSVRDMSALKDWHFQISDTVEKLITGLPDAAQPESDAYMTALAVVLLRQADVPASDPRVQRGLAWLKSQQRVTGRWWMQSLYRGNYQYITYIATAQALKAFALCDELPKLTAY
jgi:squalene-hopene/tetraprenyl-beta-curcumene cyclase